MTSSTECLSKAFWVMTSLAIIFGIAGIITPNPFLTIFQCGCIGSQITLYVINHSNVIRTEVIK